MKKLCSLLLVLLLCVSLFTGCAVKEDPVHPPKYSMFSGLLAAPMDEFYKETRLSEADLSNYAPGAYKTPLTVTFQDIPFSVSSINTDHINNYLLGFTYETPLSGDPKADAEIILSFAQYFTEALGRAHDELSVPDFERFAEMSSVELEERLSSGEYHNADHWSLGAWDTENMAAYLPVLRSTEAKYLPEEGHIPVLLFCIEAGYWQSGEKTLRLAYTIDWYWESADYGVS